MSILSPHPDLEKAGIDDVQGLSQQMQDYGIYLTAVSQDQQLTINISKKESSTTQSVYNLKDLTDEEFESFLGTMEQTEENPELEEYEVARYDGQPRELIKGKVLTETSPVSPREAAEQLAEAASAEVVQVIGSKFVLFRGKAKGQQTGRRHRNHSFHFLTRLSFTVIIIKKSRPPRLSQLSFL